MNLLNSSNLSQNPILLALSIAPAILAAIVLSLSFHPKIYEYVKRWRVPLLLAGYVLTRFVLFYVIYIALGNRDISGDIKWFQWEGLGALAGKVPYRDFRCWHSPLFPYLMAVPYGIWSNIASGILAFILFDIICLVLLCKLTRLMLGPDRVMDTAWIYVVNPAVWIITVRYGQDETIISAFLLLAVYLFMRNRGWWLPFIMISGILFTKATTIIGMAAVWTYSRHKIRDAVIVGTLMVAVCGLLQVLGADFLSPFKGQAGSIEGVSLTSLISRLLVSEHHHIIVERSSTVITLIAVAIALYLSHHRGLSIINGLTVCLIVFLLFAPVSYKFYRMWYIGPLGIYALGTGRINRFVFYSGLLCVFDDFSFKPDSPTALLYVMGSIAVAIVYLEIKYVLDLLYHKATDAIPQPVS